MSAQGGAETEALEAARRAARGLFELLAARGLRAAFAESCTGGLLSALLTELPGSSALLWGGFVAYTEEAKAELLGVSRETLASRGPVSAETAREMARGALLRSGADLAIAVTGWAGPEAPKAEGGPGRVFIAWAARGGDRIQIAEERFPGSRSGVRLAAARRAFEGALPFLSAAPEGK